MTSTRSHGAIASSQAAAELHPAGENWWIMAGRGVLAALFGAAIALWRVPVFDAVIGVVRHVRDCGRDPGDGCGAPYGPPSDGGLADRRWKASSASSSESARSSGPSFRAARSESHRVGRADRHLRDHRRRAAAARLAAHAAPRHRKRRAPSSSRSWCSPCRTPARIASHSHSPPTRSCSGIAILLASLRFRLAPPAGRSQRGRF